MNEYVCTLCGYIYKPDENNNILFEKLDDDWVCPICYAGKEVFEEIK